MNDEFALRVRSAARALWWTVLIAAIFTTVQWLAYLAILSARPAWYLRLCGPDVTWSMIQTLMLSAIVALKIGFWFVALIAIWLTLWARRLAR